jgi:hypothetical protein
MPINKFLTMFGMPINHFFIKVLYAYQSFSYQSLVCLSIIFPVKVWYDYQSFSLYKFGMPINNFPYQSFIDLPIIFLIKAWYAYQSFPCQSLVCLSIIFLI